MSTENKISVKAIGGNLKFTITSEPDNATITNVGNNSSWIRAGSSNGTFVIDSNESGVTERSTTLSITAKTQTHADYNGIASASSSYTITQFIRSRNIKITWGDVIIENGKPGVYNQEVYIIVQPDGYSGNSTRIVLQDDSIHFGDSGIGTFTGSVGESMIGVFASSANTTITLNLTITPAPGWSNYGVTSPEFGSNLPVSGKYTKSYNMTVPAGYADWEYTCGDIYIKATS